MALLGGLGVGAGGSIHGFTVGLLGAGDGGAITGVTVGGIGASCGGTLNGIALAGLGVASPEIRGISCTVGMVKSDEIEEKEGSLTGLSISAFNVWYFFILLICVS